GTTKFFFDTNDGRDTVKSFNFDNDAINIFGNKVTDVKSDSAGNVIVQINDSDDYLTIENATDKNFRFNDLIANVAENVRYNDEATQFVATASNATLTVDDVAEIWLDNSHGKFYDGDIRTLDASAAEGRTSLVGNAFNNTIIAGKGDSSLWGGEFASDDLLIGGAGKNTFFYHLGNGNDTIQGAKFGDIVDLNTLTIDQVVGEIGDGFVVLKFIDGGSLTVAGTEVEFRINNDGTTYLVDNGEWKIK
ncbi:MAG: hypothetical protein IKP64_13500, partial [Selenomonadaceae bacterium]|nr:hypothetical protein [Selenomonadaceae bacterium]